MSKRDRVVQLLPTMNNSSIAREVGLTSERVRQIRNEEGVDNPLYRMRMCTFSDNLIERLFALNPNETTNEEARDILGVSYGTLQTLKRNHGVKFKRSRIKNPYRPPFKRTKEDWEKLIEIHGNNQSKIAKAEGLTQSRVSLAFKRHGIKTPRGKNSE